MKEIAEVDIRRFEVSLAGVDDLIAKKVGWDPAKGGEANFRTHKLNISPTKITVNKSGVIKLFALFFILMGSVPILIGLSSLPQGDGLPVAMGIIFGATFVVSGLAVLGGKVLFTSDKGRGVYFRGKMSKRHGTRRRGHQGRLSDIYALQIIEERLSSDNGTFTSYELNLVFRHGERLNVMDHGDLADLERSAKTLGSFLSVPIWKAV